MAVEEKKKHQIYCFNNGATGGFGVIAVAIAEDGHCLAQHCCSDEGYMAHDLGITSDWKHENYDKHYGAGNWELVWIEASVNDPRLESALYLNSRLEESL